MMLLYSSLLYLMSFNTTPNGDYPQDSLKSHDAAFFTQKSKDQKTAATILVVTGAVGLGTTLFIALLTALGGVLLSVASLGTVEPKKHSYTIPLLFFSAALTAGIVLFSVAASNRKRAKQLSLSAGVGNTSLLKEQRFESYAYPALSLKIRF